MREFMLFGALASVMFLNSVGTVTAQEVSPPAPTFDAPSVAIPADATPSLRDDAATELMSDRSRYRWHRGRWWYWLPSERWVYWSKDHWEDYLPPPPTEAAPAQSAQAAAPTVVYRFPAANYSYPYGYPAATNYYPFSRYYGYYGGYPSVGLYFGGHGGHFYRGYSGHYGGHGFGGHGGHGGHGGGHGGHGGGHGGHGGHH